MTVKRILAVLVALAALVTVSGCSAGTAKVAATVNGQVIDENQVQSAALEVGNILSASPTYEDFDPVAFVLQNEIVGAMLTSALSQVGVTITDDQRQQLWSSSFDPTSPEYQLWTDPKTRPGLIGYIDYALVGQMSQAGGLDSNKVMSLVNAMTVTVNPRYGVWDSDNWTVSSRTLGQGSGPLADPTGFTIPS
ncbi:MAG: hypothetical protein FWF25_08300 [Propionibacteriaceae bacterium]|nr:hypothetical protein [Propionibacteriaceae bacterium]